MKSRYRFTRRKGRGVEGVIAVTLARACKVEVLLMLVS